MSENQIQKRLFKCPQCGALVPATKKGYRRTAPNHIKTMWCYKCKEEQNFVQIE